jgi:glycosyltransferase involved in cell wall biosynthesis
MPSAPPLVSILIPAYNAAPWLATTIESALAQDWPRIEIIVVDDGSRDGTLRVARQFESMRLNVVTQENRGAAAARNRALSLAQGDYIQWLDADDVLATDKITQQLRADESREPLVLLSSGFGEFMWRLEKAEFSPTLLWQDLSPVSWLTTKFETGLFMVPAVWLVSRELTEASGPWNEELTLDDDGEYFSRVVAASTLVRFVPAAKSYYRQENATSLSRASSDAACRSLLKSLKLSTMHLMRLEDSPRTRAAAIAYLQVWMQYFYPEKKALLSELDAFATELGGRLEAPVLKPPYDYIRWLFGWRAAKKALRAKFVAKLWALKHWDQAVRTFGQS